MTTHVAGFELDITTNDLIPRVRVTLGGEVVVDTTAVSITGLENLAEVFKRAAMIARQQLEDATHRAHSSG